MQYVSLIMLVLGPLTGVLVAWLLCRRDAWTETMHRVFAKVFSDMQNYRHNFVRLHSLIRACKGPTGGPVFPPTPDPELSLRLTETELNTDCLMLGLLFDKKADKLGAAIENLIASSGVFAERDKLPDLNTCFANLKRLIDNITKEMRELRESRSWWRITF